MIEILKSILIGIVQGITEWLPVSSTGHMLLLDELITLEVSDEFKNLFFVLIQLGSIFAVLLLFFRRLNPFSPSKTQAEKKDTLGIWGKVIVGSIPVALIGLPFNDIIEEKLMNSITVSAALIVYGVLFILIEKSNQKRKAKINSIEEMSYKTVFLVGAFQTLSIVPGTSRSGSTILGGMILGINRGVASEFSFFLALPAMFGASLLRCLKFIIKGFPITSAEILILIAGTITAFIVSAVTIKFLMEFVKKHSFAAFGWYRIILGILVLFFLYILPTIS